MRVCQLSQCPAELLGHGHFPWVVDISAPHPTATPSTLTCVATSVFPVAANGGLGLEVTRELARKGGHVAARPGREAGSERCRRCEVPGAWASDGADELRRALAGLMQQ
jgi:hypothetical protein